ncbi:hypothetical protein BJX68DRAFT_175803 [Aspergillus pseudodeflectus]|uniref:Uncharacterized protein n=1 Tax=Aspergillus pseudodeflectus TaxID=176178 RepID=A0ABR4KYQ1_9EURO
MPRPATKRNRLTAKKSDNSKSTQAHELSRNNALSRDISRSPRNDAVGGSRMAQSADPSEIIRQLRNQTPIGKSHEFAIGSSPATEQGATGSRPPTRARGYSSTLSIAGRKGDANSRVPGTPAFESSILSNFRRRPRQASILHMMQDEEGSSDFDDDDFLGGLSPEDESTPLNISRGKSLVLRPAESSPVKSPLPSSGKSSKRKRSIEAEAPPSPLAIASSASGSPASYSEIPEREAPVNAAPSFGSPAAFSETLAPPVSSPVPGLTHDMSTPVSDRTLSRTVKSRNSKKLQAPHEETSIPTAALQNKLLPRRRQRKTARTGASGFEVVSDSDEDLTQADEDEDELSFLPLRRRSQTRRKSASKAKPRSGGKKLGATKQYGASVREEANIDKENEPAEMSSPLSSALDSDAFDSDFLLEQEAPVKNYLSEELRLQALKFAEVDKWQMEFEDVITVQDNGEFR